MMAIPQIANEAAARVAMVEGKRPSLSVCTIALMFGMAFGAAGIGLWLVPELDMSLMGVMTNLGLSLFLGTAGVGLMLMATQKPRHELCVDPRRRQLLVLEGLPPVRQRVIRAIRYDDITRVDVSDQCLRVLGAGGAELARVPLEGPHARLDTIAQLRSQTVLPL